MASTNTMSRFETEVLTQDGNLEGLGRLNAEWVDGAMSHTAHRRVVLDGEASTGVTLILLDEGMDTGPIIAQREFPIPPDANPEALTAKLFRQGTELLLENLAPRSTATWRRRPRMIPGRPSRIWCREKTVSPAGRPRRRSWHAAAVRTLPGRVSSLSGRAKY